MLAADHASTTYICGEVLQMGSGETSPARCGIFVHLSHLTEFHFTPQLRQVPRLTPEPSSSCGSTCKALLFSRRNAVSAITWDERGVIRDHVGDHSQTSGKVQAGGLGRSPCHRARHLETRAGRGHGHPEPVGCDVKSDEAPLLPVSPARLSLAAFDAVSCRRACPFGTLSLW